MDFDVGDAEPRQTGLPCAENIAFSPKPEIFLGDAKAVLGLAQDVEPGLGGDRAKCARSAGKPDRRAGEIVAR